MTTSTGGEPSDLPEAIVEAFRKCPLMPAPQVAKLLGMNIETLREHVRAGHLPWRQKGFGQISPRRVFTLSDVAVFLDHMQRRSVQERGRLKLGLQGKKSRRAD